LKSGVAATRTTRPILCHALIESADDAITCMTYNIAMRARTRVKAVVLEPGAICLDANVLRSAVFGGGEIELGDGIVKRARGRLKIPAADPIQFPTGDNVRWEDAGISAPQFREAFDRVAFACRPGDIRAFCRSVVLADQLCVGSDGFRISMMDVEYRGHPLLVPVECVAQLRRRLVADATVQVGYVGESRIGFIAVGTEQDRIEVSLEPTTGLPLFRSAIPACEPDASATVLRRWLSTEVDRLAPFCGGSKLGPVASFSVGETLVIENKDRDSNGELTGEFTGALTMALNLSQLSAALDVADDEKVTIEFYADKGAVIRDEQRGHVQMLGQVKV
jgi:DNA polymerase III sliding clamp (beta) subunit (PCNA family)